MVVVLQVATTKATKEDQSMVLALTHKAPDPGCTPSCNQGTSFNSSNYVWSILFEYHLNPLNFRLKTSVSVITCNGEKKNAGVISTTGRTKTIQKMSFFWVTVTEIMLLYIFPDQRTILYARPSDILSEGRSHVSREGYFSLLGCLDLWQKRIAKIYESQLPLALQSAVLELEHT